MTRITSPLVSSAVSAIRTKQAIEAAELRKSGGSGYTPLASSGPVFAGSLDNSQNRILATDRGILTSGGSLVGTTFVKQVAGSAPAGVVLAYQDKNNQPGFAVYKATNIQTAQKRFKLKVVSPDEVKKLQQQDPRLQIVEVDTTTVEELQDHSPRAWVLFGILDPSENILFKILVKVLMGRTGQDDSVGEMFMVLYLRMVLLAAVIIGVAYMVTNWLM